TNQAMGFITRPQRGYTTLARFSDARFQPITALLRDHPPEVVVVMFNEHFRDDQGFSCPPPGPADQVLYHDHWPIPIVVYVKRFLPDESVEDYLISLLAASKDGLEEARRWQQEGVIPHAVERFSRRADVRIRKASPAWHSDRWEVNDP